jgi:hypothetical protein
MNYETLKLMLEHKGSSEELEIKLLKAELEELDRKISSFFKFVGEEVEYRKSMNFFERLFYKKTDFETMFAELSKENEKRRQEILTRLQEIQDVHSKDN